MGYSLTAVILATVVFSLGALILITLVWRLRKKMKQEQQKAPSLPSWGKQPLSTTKQPFESPSITPRNPPGGLYLFKTSSASSHFSPASAPVNDYPQLPIPTQLDSNSVSKSIPNNDEVQLDIVSEHVQSPHTDSIVHPTPSQSSTRLAGSSADPPTTECTSILDPTSYHSKREEDWECIGRLSGQTSPTLVVPVHTQSLSVNSTLSFHSLNISTHSRKSSVQSFSMSQRLQQLSTEAADSCQDRGSCPSTPSVTSQSSKQESAQPWSTAGSLAAGSSSSTQRQAINSGSGSFYNQPNYSTHSSTSGEYSQDGGTGRAAQHEGSFWRERYVTSEIKVGGFHTGEGFQKGIMADHQQQHDLQEGSRGSWGEDSDGDQRGMDQCITCVHWQRFPLLEEQQAVNFKHNQHTHQEQLTKPLPVLACQQPYSDFAVNNRTLTGRTVSQPLPLPSSPSPHAQARALDSVDQEDAKSCHGYSGSDVQYVFPPVRMSWSKLFKQKGDKSATCSNDQDGDSNQPSASHMPHPTPQPQPPTSTHCIPHHTTPKTPHNYVQDSPSSSPTPPAHSQHQPPHASHSTSENHAHANWNVLPEALDPLDRNSSASLLSDPSAIMQSLRDMQQRDSGLTQLALQPLTLSSTGNTSNVTSKLCSYKTSPAHSSAEAAPNPSPPAPTTSVLQGHSILFATYDTGLVQITKDGIGHPDKQLCTESECSPSQHHPTDRDWSQHAYEGSYEHGKEGNVQSESVSSDYDTNSNTTHSVSQGHTPSPAHGRKGKHHSTLPSTENTNNTQRTQAMTADESQYTGGLGNDPAGGAITPNSMVSSAEIGVDSQPSSCLSASTSPTQQAAYPSSSKRRISREASCGDSESSVQLGALSITELISQSPNQHHTIPLVSAFDKGTHHDPHLDQQNCEARQDNMPSAGADTSTHGCDVHGTPRTGDQAYSDVAQPHVIVDVDNQNVRDSPMAAVEVHVHAAPTKSRGKGSVGRNGQRPWWAVWDWGTGGGQVGKGRGGQGDGKKSRDKVRLQQKPEKPGALKGFTVNENGQHQYQIGLDSVGRVASSPMNMAIGNGDATLQGNDRDQRVSSAKSAANGSLQPNAYSPIACGTGRVGDDSGQMQPDADTKSGRVQGGIVQLQVDDSCREVMDSESMSSEEAIRRGKPGKHVNLQPLQVATSNGEPRLGKQAASCHLNPVFDGHYQVTIPLYDSEGEAQQTDIFSNQLFQSNVASGLLQSTGSSGGFDVQHD